MRLFSLSKDFVDGQLPIRISDYLRNVTGFGISCSKSSLFVSKNLTMFDWKFLQEIDIKTFSKAPFLFPRKSLCLFTSVWLREHEWSGRGDGNVSLAATFGYIIDR